MKWHQCVPLMETNFKRDLLCIVYILSNYFWWLKNKIIVSVIYFCIVNYFKNWQSQTIISYCCLWFCRLTEHIWTVLFWSFTSRMRLELSEGSSGIDIQDDSLWTTWVVSHRGDFRVVRLVIWQLAPSEWMFQKKSGSYQAN